LPLRKLKVDFARGRAAVFMIVNEKLNLLVSELAAIAVVEENSMKGYQVAAVLSCDEGQMIKAGSDFAWFACVRM